MDEVASRVKLVDAESPNAEGHVLTATVPRSQIEAALADDAGADLRLEIARIQNGERDDRVVDVSWDRADLEARSTRMSSSACSRRLTSRRREFARRHS